MNIESINLRYTKLAETECCLSCGGAINFSEPVEGEICVDLGSGKGNDALKLANKVGNSGYVYGIDIAEGMLEKAKRNAEKLNIKNVDFIRSPLDNINLPDGIVNLVISNCTLNHASDKMKVWNEIFRILKIGGRFVVSDIYALKPIPSEYRNDPEAVAECWAGAITREEYMKIIKNTGFNNISVLEESRPYVKGKAEVVSFTIKGFKPY